MAGQALYRKWRSQTFAELVGQEHVVQTLRNAIRTNRIGHAYLFTGPRGVGKTTMARLLAKAVNCLAPVEERPCDVCAECRAIAEGRAVDIIEMDAASHTGVDDARDLIEKVQFRPTTARVKVYIIDEVHMLSTAAFNALLKTLEEPPAHVLFILATTEFHKVPATIISRCQRFVFTRHSIREIVGHLEHVAVEEGVTIDPGVAEQIARAATGAMRDALSVLDQLMAGSDGHITLAQVEGLLGAVPSNEVGALIDSLVSGDVTTGLRTINQVADNGADLRQFARDLVDRLRGLMLVAATGETTDLDLPAETVSEIAEQARSAGIGQIVAWLKLFSGLDHQLKNTPYGQLPLEMALVEALTAAPAVADVRRAERQAVPQSRQAERQAVPPARPRAPAETRLEPPQRVSPPVAPSAGAAVELPTVPPEPVPAPAPGAPVPGAETIEVEDNAAFLLDEVESVWEQFRDDVRAENRNTHALVDGIVPINIEGHILVLLAGKGAWQKQKLEDEKNRRLLERVLSKLLHTSVGIRITIDEHDEMPDARKLLQHARSDSLVRKALNIFEAEIVGIDTP